LKGLHKINSNEDIYHLEAFRDGDVGENYLLEQFDKLVAFYADAAARNLGAVYYLA
jgi:hypothetical protein